MTFTDTHAHLNDLILINSIDSLLDSAKQAGFEKFMIPATDLASTRNIIELASRYNNIYAGVGIHPNDALKAAAGDWEEIVQITRRSFSTKNSCKIHAVGESGLDKYWDDCPIEVQQDYLARHLTLAQEFNLPIILHCRDAQDELLPALQAFKRSTGWMKGILHSFSSDVSFLEKCLELGLYIGFGGMITYKQKKFAPVREAAAVAPMDRILLETDCPYLTPSPMRGKAEFNQPAYAVYTAEKLAELKGVSLEQIAAATTLNAEHVFNW